MHGTDWYIMNVLKIFGGKKCTSLNFELNFDMHLPFQDIVYQDGAVFLAISLFFFCSIDFASDSPLLTSSSPGISFTNIS